MTYTIDFETLTQIHKQSLMEEVENKDMKRLLGTFTEELGESQLDPVFIQDDNSIQNKNNNEIQQQKNKNQKFINQCLL